MRPDEAFLQDIREHPDDDTPRLIFADWLEEHGQPERGEFIRIQCELARTPPEPPDFARPPFAEAAAQDKMRRALEAREKELIDRNTHAWLAPLDRAADYVWFDRGLPCVALWGQRWRQPRLLHWLFRRQEPLASLLASPAARQVWRWVQTLALEYIDDGVCEAFARSPHLAGLACLIVRGGIRAGGAQALAESPSLQSLSCLDLDNNLIGTAGAESLAGSPHLRRLTRLHLRMNDVGDEGARALADSPIVAGLAELNLSHNRIGAAGALALIDSPYLPEGLWLHIHSNPCSEVADKLRTRFARVTWGY